MLLSRQPLTEEMTMVMTTEGLDLGGIQADIELTLLSIAAKFADDGPVQHLEMLEQRQGENIRTQIKKCAEHQTKEVRRTGIIMAGCLAQIERAKLRPEHISDWAAVIYAVTVLIMNSREIHKHL